MSIFGKELTDTEKKYGFTATEKDNDIFIANTINNSSNQIENKTKNIDTDANINKKETFHNIILEKEFIDILKKDVDEYNNNKKTSNQYKKIDYQNNNKQSKKIFPKIIFILLLIFALSIIAYYFYIKYTNKAVEKKFSYTIIHNQKNKQETKDIIDTLLLKNNTNKKLNTAKEIKKNINISKHSYINVDKNKKINVFQKEKKQQDIIVNKSTDINNNKDIINKTDKITENNIENYVVQIYSSTSLEDANLRLILLNKKGIDGKITKQKIKDKIWYRVRFGNYSSYEEAKKNAKLAGFNQSWIERVK